MAVVATFTEWIEDKDGFHGAVMSIDSRRGGLEGGIAARESGDGIASLGLLCYTDAVKSSRRAFKPLYPLLATVVALAVVKEFGLDLAVVDGPSMEPALRAGQVVLVLRAAYGLRLPQGLGGYLLRWSEPKPGEVVISANPTTGLPVVKRVAEGPVREGGAPGWGLWLLGDNPARSEDSRSYGAVSPDSVAGKVVLPAVGR